MSGLNLAQSKLLYWLALVLATQAVLVKACGGGGDGCTCSQTLVRPKPALPAIPVQNILLNEAQTCGSGHAFACPCGFPNINACLGQRAPSMTNSAAAVTPGCSTLGYVQAPVNQQQSIIEGGSCGAICPCGSYQTQFYPHNSPVTQINHVCSVAPHQTSEGIQTFTQFPRCGSVNCDQSTCRSPCNPVTKYCSCGGRFCGGSSQQECSCSCRDSFENACNEKGFAETRQSCGCNKICNSGSISTCDCRGRYGGCHRDVCRSGEDCKCDFGGECDEKRCSSFCPTGYLDDCDCCGSKCRKRCDRYSEECRCGERGSSLCAGILNKCTCFIKSLLSGQLKTPLFHGALNLLS